MPISSKPAKATSTKPVQGRHRRLATIPAYSKEGKKSGTLALPKILNEARVNHNFLHQVSVGMLANLRRSTAHVKTRGEVSGGGRKPWRQKGTGRARAGSSRSPLWRGGGITHGPRNNRNFGVRITGQARRIAFRQVLSAKIRDEEVFVIASLDIAKPKTKLVEEFLQRLPLKEGRIVMIVEKVEEDLARATNNLPYLTLRSVQTVNLLDLLTADSIIITKNAFTSLEPRYAS